MEAWVGVRRLRVRCVIGVLAKERRRRQRLRITCLLRTDISRAAKTDDVADALDYREIVAIVRRTVRDGRFRLVEAAAGAIVARLADRYGPETTVRLAIEKPRAIRSGLAVVELDTSAPLR